MTPRAPRRLGDASWARWVPSAAASLAPAEQSRREAKIGPASEKRTAQPALGPVEELAVDEPFLQSADRRPRQRSARGRRYSPQARHFAGFKEESAQPAGLSKKLRASERAGPERATQTRWHCDSAAAGGPAPAPIPRRGTAARRRPPPPLEPRKAAKPGLSPPRRQSLPGLASGRFSLAALYPLGAWQALWVCSRRVQA